MAEQSTAVQTTVIPPEQFRAPDVLLPQKAAEQLKAIKAMQAVIQANLVEKFDYGTIPGTNPGTNKPTLLKAGAEKIITIFDCRPRFEVVEKIEDWERPLFYYHYKCEIVHIGSGKVIGEGEGSCNSKEDKYGYRWVGERELPIGVSKEDVPMKWRKSFGKSYPVYRTENSEVYSLVNTIQKMSMKRAMVAAALVLGRLSDLFTQDLEDIIDRTDDAGEAFDEPSREPAPKKAEAPETKETTTQSKQEQTSSTTGTEDSGFVSVTKADVDKVTKFMIEHDDELKTSSAAFSRVQAIFADREIKVDTMGKVLANPGHRKALMNYLQEQYGSCPSL